MATAKKSPAKKVAAKVATKKAPKTPAKKVFAKVVVKKAAKSAGNNGTTAAGQFLKHASKKTAMPGTGGTGPRAKGVKK